MSPRQPLRRRFGFWASLVGMAAAWIAHSADRAGNETLANVAVGVSLVCGSIALYGAVSYLADHIFKDRDS